MKFHVAILLIALAVTSGSWAPLEGRTAAGQRSQRLMLRTEDGVSIAATWYEPAFRPAPAVVFVHMLGRARRDWDGVASRLASVGSGALTIDRRGHGDSSGGSGDLVAMRQDVDAAKRHLAVRADVIHSRIGIAGASVGANLAVLAAADDPLVKSLALLSPSLDYRGVRIEAAMRKYAKRPAFLVASKEDAYAARTVGDLAKGSAGIREILLLDGAGHGTTMLARAPELGLQLAGWFRRTLQ